MIWAFIFVISLVVLAVIAETSTENEFGKFVIFTISFVVFVSTVCFVNSNAVCNIHMKAYEDNELQKEYTIKGSDTTYRWVYRGKD